LLFEKKRDNQVSDKVGKQKNREYNSGDPDVYTPIGEGIPERRAAVYIEHLS